MKTVLLLGAGRVSAPCVDYLTRKGNCKIVVSDISKDNLDILSKLFPDITAVAGDAAADASSLIDKYKPDLLMNFLPPHLMAPVAKICLNKKVNLIHPVYLDEETRKMAQDIETAGLIFVPELGLDPGIDHMAAAKTITEIHEKNGKVRSFRSFCGALPSSEANTTPWGYKLSWSPESLIGASKRTAKVLIAGEEKFWPDGQTYENVFYYDVPELGVFETYANADATVYRKEYDIPEAQTVFRGTLRYPGWCETICYMNNIKYFETDILKTHNITYAQFTSKLLGVTNNPKEALCKHFGLKPWSSFILKMQWLGFFDDRAIPFEEGSPRDVVSKLFAEKLIFTPQEKDLVALCDEIIATFPDGTKIRHESFLIDYGVPGKWTSIARTTGVPPAIAAKYILDGAIKKPGLLVPTAKEIYEPVLKELVNEDIILKEKVTNL